MVIAKVYTCIHYKGLLLGMYNEDMLVKAEALSSERSKIKLTLKNGNILNGFSIGIEPAFDYDGEELEYNVLVFNPETSDEYIEIKNEEIENVEVSVG